MMIAFEAEAEWTMRAYPFAAALLAALGAAGPVAASTPPALASEGAAPYQPFAFLVGEWVSEQGNSTIRQTIRWGPNQAYLTYSTWLQQAGGPERLHFDGIMAWNAKSKALDFLFAVEPGSGILERGSVRAEPDGTIVRDVELIAPTGEASTFRQTIRATGSNTAISSLMASRNGSWEPTFPGSERIEMKRRD